MKERWFTNLRVNGTWEGHIMMRIHDTNFDGTLLNQLIGLIKLRKRDLKIVLSNLKGYEMLGEQDLAEQSFERYLPDTDAIEKFHDIIRSGSEQDHEFKIVQPSGKMRWINLRQFNSLSEGSVDILLQDKTQEKEQLERLERSNFQLSQFVHCVSHDLRAPVANLQGLLNLAAQDMNSLDKLQGYVALMTKGVNQLDSILADLSDMVLNEKQSLELDYVSVEEELTTIIQSYHHAHKVAISVDVNEAHPLVTDVKRFRTILRNLISNSIKYQNPTEENPAIRITVSITPFRAHIAVEDNGIGIHPQYVRKIYDMFFRGTDQSSGSGLGLYIVKSMLDKLEGQISLSSTPDQGSVFSIEIPNCHERITRQTING